MYQRKYFPFFMLNVTTIIWAVPPNAVSYSALIPLRNDH